MVEFAGGGFRIKWTSLLRYIAMIAFMSILFIIFLIVTEGMAFLTWKIKIKIYMEDIILPQGHQSSNSHLATSICLYELIFHAHITEI